MRVQGRGRLRGRVRGEWRHEAGRQDRRDGALHVAAAAERYVTRREVSQTRKHERSSSNLNHSTLPPPPVLPRALDSQAVIEAELMKKTGMPRFGLPAEDGDDDVNEPYVVRRPSRTRTLPRSRSPAHSRFPIRSSPPTLSAFRLSLTPPTLASRHPSHPSHPFRLSAARRTPRPRAPMLLPATSSCSTPRRAAEEATSRPAT